MIFAMLGHRLRKVIHLSRYLSPRMGDRMGGLTETCNSECHGGCHSSSSSSSSSRVQLTSVPQVEEAIHNLGVSPFIPPDISHLRADKCTAGLGLHKREHTLTLCKGNIPLHELCIMLNIGLCLYIHQYNH